MVYVTVKAVTHVKVKVTHMKVVLLVSLMHVKMKAMIHVKVATLMIPGAWRL